MNAVNPNLGLALNIGDVINERGNNWFMNGEGYHYFLARIDGRDNKWLQISIIPDNYPGFTISVIEGTEDDMVQWVQQELNGWTIKKCNLDGLRINEFNEVETIE